MGMVFCKNSFFGELFRHLQIYGYDFQIYEWCFYDLNGTTPCL